MDNYDVLIEGKDASNAAELIRGSLPKRLISIPASFVCQEPVGEATATIRLEARGPKDARAKVAEAEPGDLEVAISEGELA